MANVDSKFSELVSHLPEWLRHDLVSSNPATRVRAEETLSAMISNIDLGVRVSPQSGWVPPAQFMEPALN